MPRFRSDGEEKSRRADRSASLRRMMLSLTFLLVAALCGAPGNCNAEPPAAAVRPNLVAIVTDDQARWAMGLYGNSDIHTPHMDRIGREGVTFVNAFVNTPVCSPSRATYLTGRWPTELRITDWISPEEAADGLGLDAVTWPQVLKQHGYRTALIGKWHLGTLPQFHPTRRGFDQFMGFLGGGSRPMDPILEVEGRETPLQGPLPDLLADEAIRFLRENQSRPFALCLHFRAPHLPYGPVPDVDSLRYKDLDPDVPLFHGVDAGQVKQWNRDYYASIASVDRNVGRVLDALESLELSGKTLVIFTSDHGYNNGRHGIDTKGNGHWIAGGVRGPKRPNMWDTSIRVPLVARWPGVIAAGTTVDHTVASIDMFRTVLGTLAIPVPESITVHGVDYSPLLRGQDMPRQRHLFGQYDLHNNGLAYLRMVRTERYKYVRHFRASHMDELYDLQSDPDEARNLLRRRQDANIGPIVQPLRDALAGWQESINDPILRLTY